MKLPEVKLETNKEQAMPALSKETQDTNTHKKKTQKHKQTERSRMN